MSFADALLLAHLAATLSMVGIIWFVQVVHYPLFRDVGDAGFPAYAAAHITRTGRVVGPLMVIELASGLLLLRWRPTAVPGALAVLGIALLIVIWLSTRLLQVPRHRLLGQGYDAVIGRSLVMTNWLRTVAWTVRGVLVLLMIARMLAA